MTGMRERERKGRDEMEWGGMEWNKKERKRKERKRKERQGIEWKVRGLEWNR